MVKAPFISTESVRIALDSMLYSSSNKDIVLLLLLLVDEFLVQPDLPYSSLNREFALNNILTSLITDEFTHQRNVYGYQIPKSDTSPETVFEMIRRDAESMSPELIGWSWLYHHYVRIDLNIHAQVYCDLFHVEQRTLRRYQQHILKRLTNLLIENEWSARRRQRNRRLISELPRSANFEPVAVREDTANYVNRMINVAKPAHFCISGSRGIGKTTFVEELVYNQIETGGVDQLVWIQMPVSTPYVYNYLIERLAPPENQIELREYLLLHRTIIVLDDAELLFNELSQLKNLLNILSPTVVFMTCSGRFAALQDVIDVTLHEFNEHDVKTFAAHILAITQYAAPINDDQITTIWNRVGGNPLALQMIIRNLPYFDLKSIENLLGLNTIYGRIFQLLDEKGRIAWLILALRSSEEVEFSIFQGLWSKHITRDAIGNLLQYHVVETVSALPRYRLINGARRYIEDVYRQDVYIHKLIHQLLREFDDAISYDIEHANQYLFQLEYFLLTDWVELDTDLRNKWVTSWWSEGVRSCHWSTWRTLLERQMESDVLDTKIYLGYAICLQHLDEWMLAQQIIEIIIVETGQKGSFVEQAEALMQLSPILRYRGEYEQALETLARVKKTALRYDSNFLLSSLSIEQIHLAVDLGDPQFAESYVVNLPNNVQGYFLKSEFYFIKGYYEQSRDYAELALQYAKSDFAFRAHIYTLIGRICEQENDLKGAEENFSWTLMILDQHDYSFALSRAQLNLGALFIRTGYYQEARILLQAAEEIQIRLGNQVTLIAIQHNLRLLDIAFFN